jgi:hypothetical protein
MARTSFVVLAFCLVATIRVAGQDGFDPKTVETIVGDVTSIARTTGKLQAVGGVHAMIKTENGTISVHLGPEWFLEKQGVQIAVSDRLEITGSRINVEGEPAIVASIVTKGKGRLELRDEKGVPRWAGWRMGRPESAPAADVRRGAGREARWWAAGSSYDRLYDPKTVVKLAGEVTCVNDFAPRGAISRGVHATLKTEAETISVHLGPAWYLESQDAHIAVGDKIEVTGSRVTFEGGPAVVASSVKKGDEQLELRDQVGFPRWAAWRNREESAPVVRTTRGRGRGGWWASGSAYDWLFDSKTVVTLAGEVTSLGDFTPRDAVGRGLHVMLKTEKETISIHLGPEWYLEKQDLHLAIGDKIEVTGSRIDFEGKPAIVGAMVKKGDDRLELRDQHGFPRWAGWRRRAE